MARPTSKADLLSAATERFEELNALINGLSGQELNTPFDFSQDAKKKEAHWRRDRNLRDVLVHLYEWHQLLLLWVDANLAGEARPFLPAPYNWASYGGMNQGFFDKHQQTPLKEADQLYRQSHADVLRLAERFTDAQLFEKNAFPWVGGSTLGAYFVSATASHYDWAIKKLKAHRKNCGCNP